MARYSIKMVDHTALAEEERQKICVALQEYYTQVFDGTSDSSLVSWGEGKTGDHIVIHFVKDVDDSHLEKKMPGKPLSKAIAGHTRERNSTVCSEIYRFVSIRGKVKEVRPALYARVAFHESMHNVEPSATEAEINATGGLGASPIGDALTDANKEFIRKRIVKKRSQQF